MENGASVAPPHPPPVDAYIPLAREPNGPWWFSGGGSLSSLSTRYFWWQYPSLTIGELAPPVGVDFPSCDFDTTKWTRLATIQLVGEAMEWWRTIGTRPREISWQTFCYDITHRFLVDEPPVATPLVMHPSPPPQPVISFTTIRLAIMRVLWWKAREGKELESYLQRFINEIVNISPIPLSEEEQCFHF